MCGTYMHTTQSKERARGLCLHHPGCDLSAQVGSILVKYGSSFWCWPYQSFVLQLPAGVLAGCSMCARRGCRRVVVHSIFLPTRRGAEPRLCVKYVLCARSRQCVKGRRRRMRWRPLFLVRHACLELCRLMPAGRPCRAGLLVFFLSFFNLRVFIKE